LSLFFLDLFLFYLSLSLSLLSLSLLDRESSLYEREMLGATWSQLEAASLSQLETASLSLEEALSLSRFILDQEGPLSFCVSYINLSLYLSILGERGLCLEKKERERERDSPLC
jgi:hypothetical protein